MCVRVLWWTSIIFFQRQRTRAQQKLDLAPANFPPLPTSSDNGTTAPAPAPPPQNHVEEGVSNLADIVKGKRLKDGGGVNATGANCLPEKQSKGNSQVVAKVQPSSQASQPPRPPRSDTRVRVVQYMCGHFCRKCRFIHCTHTFTFSPLFSLLHSSSPPPLLLSSFPFSFTPPFFPSLSSLLPSSPSFLHPPADSH